MRAINEPLKEKSLSRFTSDLYILSYGQNHHNILTKQLTLSPEVEQHNHPSQAHNGLLAGAIVAAKADRQKDGVTHRWKNIDRLVQMLKRGSKSRPKDESACSRLFRQIQKMHDNYWRLHSPAIKVIGFARIKHLSDSSQLPKLKHSLQFAPNQIQQGYSHLELDDLMQMVGTHDEAQQGNLRNSLSRQLILQQQAIEQTNPSSKIGNNLYILRNNTKEDLSTRNDILTTTATISHQFLPITTPVSPHSQSLSVEESPVHTVPLHSEVKHSRLQHLKPDSMRPDKSQEIDEEERQCVTNLKLPSFADNNFSQPSKVRANRLINPKIFFHYRRSQEKASSPLKDYFPATPPKLTIPPQKQTKQAQATNAKPNTINQSNILPQSPNHTTRMQRISSLRTHKVIANHQVPPKAAQITKEGSAESRRCYSMPKITFTYKKQAQTSMDDCPIRQTIDKGWPTSDLSKKQGKQYPYLCKNTPVTNKSKQQINTLTPILYPNHFPQNDYNIPLNKYVSITPIKHNTPHTITQKSPDQPPTPFLADHTGRQDYYGQKTRQIPTQDTLPSPNSGNKMRVRSTDAYILTKPPMIEAANLMVKVGSAERERAKSCGMKIQLVSKFPVIKAC